MKSDRAINQLIEHAMQLGVSAAKSIPAHRLSVEARFADYCSQQPCPGFGKSINCPPHAMRPDQFRGVLAQHHTALVFKFDVATKILQSDERLREFKKLHLCASDLERKALDLGLGRAHGLAAGSCWQVFCAGKGECPALTDPNKCRFPQKARPSVSSQGVDVYKLCEDLDWSINRITKETNPDSVPMGLLAALVLLG